MKFFTRDRRLIYSAVIYVYRNLPVSTKSRLLLKNAAFKLFGPIFKNTVAYKVWLDYRKVLANPARYGLSSDVNQQASDLVVSMGALNVADGSWEWRDYDDLKTKIIRFKREMTSLDISKPLSLIDIRNESMRPAATSINLPPISDNPVVSILIPVFNNLKLTIECLLSIARNLDPEISVEVILADDASDDDTFSTVSLIHNLRYIKNDTNLGFIKNCNNALQYVRGEYVVYLNNDVQVTKGWLRSLLKIFLAYDKVGAVGPKFLYPSGHLQEAGGALRDDCTAEMIGLNDDPDRPRYSYVRRVDYISGACLMVPTKLLKQLAGFSEDFVPCYYEDVDLCLRIQSAGYAVYYNPESTIIHKLSQTTATLDSKYKLNNIAHNLVKFRQKWHDFVDNRVAPRIIAFYLPQFHPFPENDYWWGVGFTEWRNVAKAKPNFIGHYQPRLPSDLGFYDLRVDEIMEQQAAIAQRYGIFGFCFYYYWFNGKRLMEKPLEKMLASGKPDMPFCLCWANENWSRRWDGLDQDILIEQLYSPEDDAAVIKDLIRYFQDKRYICIDGRPLILVYKVADFPNFALTAYNWRRICRQCGIGEIYIAMVESTGLVHANKHPQEFNCDASVEFPPLEMGFQKVPSGEVVNPNYKGHVADYRDIALRYATRDFPGYTRFKGVMPGWDNTARRQDNSYCFENATPGAFQAWLEESIEQTRQQYSGEERLLFINAMNEWAEGAYLEPDSRFGHTFLEAVKNATESSRLLRVNKYYDQG